MTDDPGKMSCAEFQAHMPELIASGADLSNDEHLKSCELCRALLDDLETIAEAARQLFPSVDPSDKLWSQIESAIKSDSAVDDSAKQPAPEPAQELRDDLKQGLEAGLTPQTE